MKCGRQPWPPAITASGPLISIAEFGGLRTATRPAKLACFYLLERRQSQHDFSQHDFSQHDFFSKKNRSLPNFP
jgi:hypothetical protein